jgi:hypothetical protein
MPAAGYTLTARKAVSAGPAMKMTSSVADSSANAQLACSVPGPHRADQAERTIAPRAGSADAAAVPLTNSSQTGARAWAAAMKAAVKAAKTTACGSRTRTAP